MTLPNKTAILLTQVLLFCLGHKQILAMRPAVVNEIRYDDYLGCKVCWCCRKRFPKQPRGPTMIRPKNIFEHPCELTSYILSATTVRKPSSLGYGFLKSDMYFRKDPRMTEVVFPMNQKIYVDWYLDPEKQNHCGLNIKIGWTFMTLRVFLNIALVIFQVN